MTIGTLLHTWIYGELVGTDEFGNHYYRSRRLKLHRRERRWVLYKGEPEASRVPPEWHAWLHHVSEQPLTERAAQPHTWQRPHEANPTGTRDAYRPPGHDYRGAHRAKASGDYEPWTPR
jgi:NADH:ubiquinone oxidoreductase subunit